MAGKTFHSAYAMLNEAQKKAVDTIEGPVMVIAGPGTGKTQILTLRIANILRKTDTAPDSILALTFTESGVFSMRKRLVEMIGSAGYRVHIHTFHGFCNDIIKGYPDSFPRIIGATNINDVDKIGILKEIILNEELDLLKPFGDNYYYVNHLKGKIAELKRENISPLKLDAIVETQQKAYDDIPDLVYEKGAHKGKIKGKYKDRQKKIDKNRELARIYHAYEEALRKRRYYDYEDMIVETINVLETHEDLLLMLQEEYQYVLADEHQDANNAQNRLLELLTSFHESPNLFIVGDEKQAIFRFQGASLDNFLYFKERFDNALLITLEENYRSTQAILDSAHSLIEKSPVEEPGLRKRLKSNTSAPTTPIEIRSFSTADMELLFLASDIQKRIDEGVDPEEIAIIYRNNKDAEPITHVFEKTKVPFVIESDQNILRDHDIQKFIALLRAIAHFGDDAYLIDLLHADFLDLPNLDIYKLIRYANTTKTSLYDVLSDQTALKEANVSDQDMLGELYARLSRWKRASENQSVLDSVQAFASESGFVEYLLGHVESVEKLEKLGGLFRDITRLIENHKEYRFMDLIGYFQDIDDHDILIKKDSKQSAPGAVRLMTAHKSKGLEFDYVYIVGAYDTHFGNQRSIQHFDISQNAEVGDRIDDERRLFYVALTRARVHASISYARLGSSGKQQLPSQFIEEIDEALVEYVDTETFESNVDTTILLRPGRKVVVPPIDDKAFLNSVFLEQGLSVTALNNYLNCPWNYFYSNLLRVPKVPTKHLLFGTVVHRVLKDFFNRLRDGEAMDEKALLKLFEDYVNEVPFTESEQKEAREKGLHALSGYYRTYAQSFNPHTLNEFRISTLLPVDIEGVGQLKLRGDLDKMEIGPDDRRVVVVDYKTGKPKSRNVILGKTKNSNGEYHRQLVFYKLLLSLFDDERFVMEEGQIDFVEPDERGKYHKESFEISQEEVVQLREVITQTAKEILDLAFWDSRCGEKACEYCALREKMGT